MSDCNSIAEIEVDRALLRAEAEELRQQVSDLTSKLSDMEQQLEASERRFENRLRVESEVACKDAYNEGIDDAIKNPVGFTLVSSIGEVATIDRKPIVFSTRTAAYLYALTMNWGTQYKVYPITDNEITRRLR